MLSSLKKRIAGLVFPDLRSSYAQSGEDIIISDLFTRLGIEKPSYLDIGANEPFALSNTYRLYKRGCKGVCIEPNPRLAQKFKQKRKRDVVLNMGIAFNESKEADYYLFAGNAHGFSTFSKEEADFWVHTGNDRVGKFKVDKIIKTPLIPINEVIEQYFSPWPNFITIDVEGLDLSILKTLDFDRFQTEIFCVETLVYESGNKESKNLNLINFFTDKGYFNYADTYINTIFCKEDVYKKRWDTSH